MKKRTEHVSSAPTSGDELPATATSSSNVGLPPSVGLGVAASALSAAHQVLGDSESSSERRKRTGKDKRTAADSSSSEERIGAAATALRVATIATERLDTRGSSKTRDKRAGNRQGMSDDSSSSDPDREVGVAAAAANMGGSDSSSSSDDDGRDCREPARLPHRHKPRVKPKVPPLVMIVNYRKIRRLFAAHAKDKDKSPLIGARQAFLTNISAQNARYTNEDLFQTLRLAFFENDKEVAYAILDLFPSKRILKTGPLFNLILSKFEEINAITNWRDRVRSWCFPNPFKERVERVVHATLDNGTIHLTFKQLKRLLVRAVNNHDYNFVAELLNSPLKTPSILQRKSLEIFEVFETKIREYYSKYEKDKKSLFRLVGVKRVFSHVEWLSCKNVPVARVKALAELSLQHNNILFVEIWIRQKPELLQDKEFMARVRPKYKAALRNLLLDPHARDGYGVYAIGNYLRSEVLRKPNPRKKTKVLREGDLKDLFTKEELLDIFTTISPSWRKALQDMFGQFGIRMPIPQTAVQDSSEQWAQHCKNGDVDKVKEVIANGRFDLSRVRFEGKTLLYYAASYGDGDEDKFPKTTLRQSLDEQKEDPHFQILSKNKNEVVRLLLRNYKFKQEDVQEAFNKAYQDGIVKRHRKHLFSREVERDQNLETRYALRGDHGIMRQLIAHNADISIGKSFLGIWRAIGVSYASAVGLDLVLGVGADLIEEYVKIPTGRWYKRLAPWVSASSSALTFEATGAVLEYYHRTWNRDYYENNLYDLRDAPVTGTQATNWYGGIVFGHKLESKMSRKVGVTGSDRAIYDADDITDKNRGLHYQIAMRNYQVYLNIRERAGEAGWLKRRGHNKHLDELERVNERCEYGVPGDNHYSFNVKFQTKLAELFGDKDNYVQVKESILYNRRNRYFFLDLAKGVEKGLVKVPLELKKQILDMSCDVLRTLDKPPNIVAQQNLPFVFGELIDIYYDHTNNRVPLSVLFVAQFFKERKTMGLAVQPTRWERAWGNVVYGWDKALGVIAPPFGGTKERAHELVAGTLQSTASLIVGGLNYYENKLRNEIIDEGVMKSLSHLMIIATSSMYGLAKIGVSPMFTIPVLGFAIAYMYCRHKQIDPTKPFKDLHKAYKAARKPVKDRTKVFINRETRWKFNALFQDMNISKIPAQVHYAM